jgi:hypothetical protein
MDGLEQRGGNGKASEQNLAILVQDGAVGACASWVGWRRHY